MKKGWMIDESLIYRIALTLIPGVGDIMGKKLVTLCGSAEAVFREPGKHLKKVPRLKNLLSHGSGTKEILELAEKEARFIDRFRITPLYFQDPAYPQRLKHCFDSPVMLYYKGNADLNVTRVLGIVGTRSATAYGKAVTQQMIHELVAHQPLVVSGLAYGIDGHAHRCSLEKGLNTIGVLGHGLDRIYPFLHKSLAERMLSHGGLLTEFLSGSKPDRENFPKRNRIIAGLCDVIVVVEAAEKGGALITADIANSYHRDVFAIPGRVNDPYSVGTNFLIRTNRASLIQKPEDLEILMGWKQEANAPSVVQRKIFQELTPHEEVIVKLLEERKQVPIDEIVNLTDMTTSQAAAALLNLEFEGLIKCFPGKVYELL